MRPPILIHGDCLEVLASLKPGSVDLILTDPPYGTTACSWDTVIPIEAMWKQLKRVAKPTTPIVLFGTEPFSSLLRTSNLSQYKYDWIWYKDLATNHLNAKKMPMRRTELISVFYGAPCFYDPQLVRNPTGTAKVREVQRKQSDHYGSMTSKSVRTIPAGMSYPLETLYFSRGKRKGAHPTQKPVDLLRYLIRTYTKAGEVVLDFTMGSGSTGVAAVKKSRQFIGIELDPEYFITANERIHRAPGGSIEQQIREMDNGS